MGLDVPHRRAPTAASATPDDVVTLNELHVPVGRPVYLKLRSKDVVHSLYLPNFRTKIDAIPGSTTRLWFQAQEAGPLRDRLRPALRREPLQDARLAGRRRPRTSTRAWLARAETDSRLRYDPADAAAQPERLGLGDGQ